jgi:hypothetical protein
MGHLANLPTFQPGPVEYTAADFNAAFAALTLALGVVTTNHMNLPAPSKALLEAATAAAQKALLEKAGSPIVAMAALDVDCAAGAYFTKTIAANSTFTFSNPPAEGAYGFTLELTHTSGTITWPASVKWPNDTAPTLQTGKTHLCAFVTSNGGTRWRGAILPNYVT